MKATEQLAQALRELLEAGDYCVTCDNPVLTMLRFGEAVDAARAALATWEAEKAGGERAGSDTERQGEAVAWVSESTLKIAEVSRERGGPFDSHTWSEGKTDYFDTPLYAAPLAQPAAHEPNAKLMELADKIDHEKNWRLSGIDQRDTLTQDQQDRLMAGVHLRRYADLLGNDGWRIFPPRPGMSFRAGTLDAVVAMARRDEERRNGIGSTASKEGGPE